jgi:SSS family solute:Na+ symporter
MALVILILYLALVLGIGLFSNRFLRRTGEDYFVATRSIGPVILLLSLFGTNMTAFAIMGASAEAFREGIGVFGLMASISALVIPCIFFFVGTRVWAIGKKHGYISPIQYFRQRWESDSLGLLIFAALVVFVIPHLLTAPLGGGLTLRTLTRGHTSADGLPTWVGATLICVPVLIYVFFGGLRGTVWVQSFETLVFMIVGLIAMMVVVGKLGGLHEVMEKVATNTQQMAIHKKNHPELSVSNLLAREGMIGPLEFFSYTLIPLSVGMFPHMWIHLLAARSLKTFRTTLVAYPLCIAAVWVPSVFLGVIAAGQYPNLSAPPQINSVIIRLINDQSGTLLFGMVGPLVGAAVFAAIMSTLDSQILSIGSMFTQDLVVHYGYHDHISEAGRVWLGRGFVVGLLAAVFVAAQYASARFIFNMSIWSFTAFSSLFPVVVAAIFWKRSTKYGAYASVLSVAVLVPLFFVLADFGKSKLIDLGAWFGLSHRLECLPVLLIAPLSALLMVVVSLCTPPPSAETLEQFYPSSPSSEETARLQTAV